MAVTILCTTRTPEKQRDSILNARFDTIDALRGLAAMMVVLHHCCGCIQGNFWPRLNVLGFVLYPTHLLDFGYIGVDLFLVLSGFCLSYPFLSKTERPFDWKVYARKRFRRIYPAYFITFISLLCIGWLCRHSSNPTIFGLPFAKHLSAGQIAAALTLQMTHLNPVFWSLCLEGRWYLLFLFVLLMARKHSIWPLFPVSVVLSLLMPVVQHGILSPLKLVIFLPAFLAGVLVAEVYTRSHAPIHAMLLRAAVIGFVLFLLICSLVIPTLNSTARRSFQEVLPTTGLFFFLVLLALGHQGKLSGIWKGLQHIGIFSYSLYLIHLPFLDLASSLLHPSNWSPGAQFLFWVCFYTPLLVILSYLFYLVAEKPFLEKSASTMLPSRRRQSKVST